MEASAAETGATARGRAGALADPVLFAGLCAFCTAQQLFGNLVVLKSVGAFNTSLYAMSVQVGLFIAVGVVGLRYDLGPMRHIAPVGGVLAAVGVPLGAALASPVAGCVAAAAGGAGLAIVSLAWGSRLSVMPPRSLCVQIAFALFVGSCVCAACSLAPAPVGTVLFALMALASCAPLALRAPLPGSAAERSDAAPRAQEAGCSIPVSLLLALGACCLVSAFFSGATMNPYAIQSAAVAGIAHVGTVIGFGALAAACAARGRMPLQAVMLVGLGVLLVGLIMLSTGVAGSVIVPIAVIGVARTFLWGVAWIVLAGLASARPDRAAGVFGAGLLVADGALGRGVGIICSSEHIVGFTDLALVGVFAIAGIAALYGVMSSTGDAVRTVAVGFPLGGAGTARAGGAVAEGAPSATLSAPGPAEPAGPALAGEVAPAQAQAKAQDQAPDYATAPFDPFAVFDLSDRERQLAELIAEGRTYVAIAEHLGISERTVKYHAGNIFKKAGVANRHEFAEAIERQRANAPLVLF